ncbi:MAG TPA: hypothetical protein VNH46_07115, partial [Gemmatimonadales bacterium]|nr:hypothetical protein [Gemmatimonadales bacterium]
MIRLYHSPRPPARSWFCGAAPFLRQVPPSTRQRLVSAAAEDTRVHQGPGLAQLGLPRRVAGITALLAVLLVVGSTELALSLAERSRLQDLRQESIELAVTLSAYLGRIAPTGEPSALGVGLGGWSRRHLTKTTAVVYVIRGRDSLVQAAASEGAITRPATALDQEALRARAPAVRFRSDSTPAWEVAVPVGRTRSRPYGVLEVRVYTGRLDQWARVERRRAYALALGSALLLSIGVWLLFTRWV